uniref:Proteasome subunit alpha type-5-like n=1 Tax=Nicotiana tabacum TaxID=4097 RepID=A0A1S4CAN4_TOBAC|nr:PREDICTED: proteasome subunit alpha type-5-like [Nicotiana tabacum]
MNTSDDCCEFPGNTSDSLTSSNELVLIQTWIRLALAIYFHGNHEIKETSGTLLTICRLICRYYTDPSGTFWQCNAKAIGSGSEGADSSLQEQFNKDLTLKEAETIALSILKQVMEEKVTPNNVDIARVSPTYHLYSPSEVETVISRL